VARLGTLLEIYSPGLCRARRVHPLRFVVLILSGLSLATSAIAGGTLRIGLNDDPDTLDPAVGGTFTGRIVFAAVCDKLIDTDAKNNLVPQLATNWRWSTDARTLTIRLRSGVHFQDGRLMDAEAVRANLERYRTAPESVRKTELKPVTAVEVIDPRTVRLRLSQPYAPLPAVLADRAGMMISPDAIRDPDKPLADTLPCAGPFRLARRIPQDRIVVERFPGYWNAAAVKVDRIVYEPIPNATVRLVDLKAGQLDMVERLGPTDAPQVKADQHLRLVTATALAYDTISINVAHGLQSKALGNRLVRLALADSIDRAALNHVVMAGLFVPSNQFEAPGTRYWDPAQPVPARRLREAKALLREAGDERPAFTLLVGNDPVAMEAGQVIQAMADEAGFEIKVQAMEANALTAATRAGNYQAALVIWSGRPDPDGNVSIWLQCDGFVNWGHYCNPRLDALLAKARAVNSAAQRQAMYRQVVAIYLHDVPNIVLEHYTWLWALSDRVQGFVPTPDGLIRPQGISIAP
jgi:peptide/nickel transport system substrate-binding protein